MILNRRKFLKDAASTLATGALLGTLSPSFVFASGGHGVGRVFYIFAYGGWDTKYAFPYTSGQLKGIYEGFRPNTTVSDPILPNGFNQPLSSHIGFHPNWQGMLDEVEASGCKISLISEYGVTEGSSRSHQVAQQHFFNGENRTGADIRQGWLGKLAENCEITQAFTAWTFGLDEPRFMENESARLMAVSSLSNFDFEDRRHFSRFNCRNLSTCPESGDRFYDRLDSSAYARWIAKRLLSTDPSDIDLKQAYNETLQGAYDAVGVVQQDIRNVPLDISKFRPPSNSQHNFQTRVHDMAQAAIWLSSPQAPKDIREAPQVFCTGIGGWDNHSNLVQSASSNIETLGYALKGLIHYLKQNNILDSSVIVVNGEFCRTSRENSSRGTDHAAGGRGLVIGGNLRTHGVLGTLPDISEVMSRNYTTPQVAYTGVLKQALKHIGFAPSCVDASFPVNMPGENSINLF